MLVKVCGRYRGRFEVQELKEKSDLSIENRIFIENFLTESLNLLCKLQKYIWGLSDNFLIQTRKIPESLKISLVFFSLKVTRYVILWDGILV
jgi:hypothetical protein